MKLTPRALTLSLVAITLTAAAFGVGAITRALDPTVVAIVDIDRLSTEMEEFKVPREEFQTMQDTRREQLRAIQTRMNSVAEELELIPEGDQNARIDKLTEQAMLDSELATRQQIYQQAADLEQAQLFKRMYDRIQTGAKTIAQRDGIDLVLVDDRVFALSATNRGAQRAMLESKKVLYAAGAVDITDELLTLLNNEFTTGQ